MNLPPNDPLRDRIAANLAEVNRRIADAARRAGRDPRDVTLVAVTKSHDVPVVNAAIDCGITIIGENRIQEAQRKFAQVGKKVEWHFIGHLQKNKVKYIFDFFSLIHAIDSAELAEEISRRAAGRPGGDEIACLLQVNIGGEATKHGIPPETALETARAIGRLPHIRLKGLMAVPPPVEHAEESRTHFRALMEIKREIERMNIENVTMNTMSFGMSDDYEIAVEEGATHVRIGSALFGERDVTR